MFIRTRKKNPFAGARKWFCLCLMEKSRRYSVVWTRGETWIQARQRRGFSRNASLGRGRHMLIHTRKKNPFAGARKWFCLCLMEKSGRCSVVWARGETRAQARQRRGFSREVSPLSGWGRVRRDPVEAQGTEPAGIGNGYPAFAGRLYALAYANGRLAQSFPWDAGKVAAPPYGSSGAFDSPAPASRGSVRAQTKPANAKIVRIRRKNGGNFCFLRQPHMQSAVTYVQVRSLACKSASLACNLSYYSASLLTLPTSCPAPRSRGPVLERV